MKVIKYLAVSFMLSFLSLGAFAQNNIDTYGTDLPKNAVHRLKKDISNFTKFKPTSLPNVAYYGQISSKTGRAKTNHVDGYYKGNGTYVQPYYRS